VRLKGVEPMRRVALALMLVVGAIAVGVATTARAPVDDVGTCG
jgi:hypothetical protein